MQRRGRSGQPVKGQSANGPKARKAPTAHVSTDHSPEQIERLVRERDEALEQQRATSEVLKVISSSPGELEPVFKAMLESALRICEAEFGMLMLHSGDGSFDTRVMVGAPPALVDVLLYQSFTPPPGNPLDRMLRTKKTVHVVDAAAEKAKPLSALLAGARSHISVPMVKQKEVVGAISIYRTEVRPFTDRQIELVTNFAAQAVIAIDNARLLNELRESLQQQTATADVLKVISSSPGELQPVFQEMLANAMRICEAKFGILFEFADGAFLALSSFNIPPAFADFFREWRIWGPDTGLGQLARTKQTIHVKDTAALTLKEIRVVWLP
jgi:transcriptional regulator with GAF, ATPase, and Fis domain